MISPEGEKVGLVKVSSRWNAVFPVLLHVR
jgi:hypothetical protein